METINFEDFKKIEIRIGKILTAEKVEDSNKLLKLQVDFGVIASQGAVLHPASQSRNNAEQTQNNAESTQTNAETNEKREVRQILAGIAKFYQPEQLIGKLCPFVSNLEPKMMGELESQGMILCADNGEPVLLHPDKEITPGSIVE